MLCLLLSMLFPVPDDFRSWAQTPQMSLAVLDFVLNLDLANADTLAADQLPVILAGAQIRAQAAASPLYNLVAEQAVAQAVQAFGESCRHDACALHIAQTLGVQRVVWGQVTKVSALIWYVSVRLLDVPSAMLVCAETIQFRGNITEIMPHVMAIMWRRLHEAA